MSGVLKIGLRLTVLEYPATVEAADVDEHMSEDAYNIAKKAYRVVKVKTFFVNGVNPEM